MITKVGIPVALQGYAGGKSEISLNGENIRELLQDMVNKTPELGQKIFNEAGEIRRFINIYLNDENIRVLKRENTPVKKGDKVLIIFAIAGG